MREILLGYGVFAMYYVFTVNFIYLSMTMLSLTNVFRSVKRSAYSRFKGFVGSDQVPPVSILVPAYNEELTIIDNVKSLLALHYPKYEVIVINDGSKDDTLNALIEEFELEYLPNVSVEKMVHSSPLRGVYHNPRYPKLYVIDKNNGGKADSLNTGINFSHYPLIASIDADSLLEKDALIRIARVYMENPEETVAVGGNVRIANGCKIENGMVKKVSLPRKILPMFQTVEYMKAFLSGRIGWSAINGLIIVSGAFGVFRKDYVVKVGGYREGFPGEDMNIIIKLHKYMQEQKLKYRIAFCPDAVCWTQAPDTLRILGSQRKRWGRGNLKNMVEYRQMFFNPKYKVFGLLTMPYNIFFETLNPYFKMSGLLALVAYALMDMTYIDILLIFAAINFLFGYLLSVISLIMEEMVFRNSHRFRDHVKILGHAFLMFFGYYQIGWVWRFLGHIEYLRNNNTWGVMTRQSWKTESTKSQTT